jgi:hypothetical protein
MIRGVIPDFERITLRAIDCGPANFLDHSLKTERGLES